MRLTCGGFATSARAARPIAEAMGRRMAAGGLLGWTFAALAVVWSPGVDAGDCFGSAVDLWDCTPLIGLCSIEVRVCATIEVAPLVHPCSFSFSGDVLAHVHA